LKLLLNSKKRIEVQIIEGSPKKLRKKQRRSRSPLLYPAVCTANGERALVKMPAGVSPKLNTTMDCLIVSDAEESEIVVCPAVESMSEIPQDARLLSSLRVGDQVNATIIRSIGINVYLTHAENIFRAGPNGSLLPVRAALRSAGHIFSRGASISGHVVLAEPNSARLTLSLKPVSPQTLKKQRNLQRLRRQMRRGTLQPGAVRMATIIEIFPNYFKVDAGGLTSLVSRRLGADLLYSVGDTIAVRVVQLCQKTGRAQLELLSPSSPPSFSSSSSSDNCGDDSSSISSSSADRQ